MKTYTNGHSRLKSPFHREFYVHLNMHIFSIDLIMIIEHWSRSKIIASFNQNHKMELNYTNPYLFGPLANWFFNLLKIELKMTIEVTQQNAITHPSWISIFVFIFIWIFLFQTATSVQHLCTTFDDLIRTTSIFHLRWFKRKKLSQMQESWWI